MSCFIVKNESILKIVKGLVVLLGNKELKIEAEKIINQINYSYNTYQSNIRDYSLKEFINVCCKQLKRLNYQAYQFCYSENMDQELSDLQAIDFTRFNINNPYLNLAMPNSIYQYVKTLECFLYQCHEGYIPDDELYKALQNLVIKIKCWSFNKNQIYQNAEWE